MFPLESLSIIPALCKDVSKASAILLEPAYQALKKSGFSPIQLLCAAFLISGLLVMPQYQLSLITTKSEWSLTHSIISLRTLLYVGVCEGAICFTILNIFLINPHQYGVAAPVRISKIVEYLFRHKAHLRQRPARCAFFDVLI
jgi:hypothetical protein